VKREEMARISSEELNQRTLLEKRKMRAKSCKKLYPTY
jgi:hypothetical protein